MSKKTVKITENELVDLIDKIVNETVSVKKKQWIAEQKAKNTNLLESKIAKLEAKVKQIIKEETESPINKINNEKIQNFITRFLELNEKNLKFINKLYKELTNEEKYIVMCIFGSEHFKDVNQIKKANDLYWSYETHDLSNANEIEKFYWLVAHANGREIYKSFDGQKLWDEYRSIY